MLKTSVFFNVRNRCSNVPLLTRFFSATSEHKRVCIIGSGPAGFYTAQQLLKDNEIEVDIYEKLPVPFGLIRYGVAPDHSDIKNCIKNFNQFALHDKCRFYGNVNVGKDVMVSDLLQSYHAVVLAYGACGDQELGVPGENCKNVFSARKFVGWYNGHPDFVDEPVDLNTDTATVIGHGNVALDVARMLLKDLDKLKVTDIAEYAYEALTKSRIKRVVLVGRRGPLQISFTTKEFREFISLPGCHVEVQQDPVVEKVFEALPDLDVPRPNKKMVHLMANNYQHQNDPDSREAKKYCELKFLRTPKEILPDKNGRVEKVIFNINEIEDLLTTKKSPLTVTSKEDTVNCGLVIRSVGYKNFPVDSFIPFDYTKHIIPHKQGRVNDVKGLYCSGWVKTGPVGVLASTMNFAFETAACLKNDLSKGELSHDVPKGRDDILDLLKKKGVKYVTYKDWQKMDEYELQQGQAKGKLRDKIYRIEEMLKFVES